jgi:DNA-binding transcriptional LysR family regulator
MELDSYELLKRLIIAGMGIGFLPRINILTELRAGLIKVVPTEGIVIPRNLALISHSGRELTRAGHAFFSVATRGTHPSAARAANSPNDAPRIYNDEFEGDSF